MITDIPMALGHHDASENNGMTPESRVRNRRLAASMTRGSDGRAPVHAGLVERDVI